MLLFLLIMVTTTIVHASVTCEPPYDVVGGQCLEVKGSGLPWDRARDTCKLMEGKLVELNGQDINHLVSHLKGLGHGKGQWWVGAYWMNRGKGFRWLSTNISVTSNWEDGGPGTNDIQNDHSKDESCVELRLTGVYNDQKCDESRAYVCEHVPTNTSPIPTPVINNIVKSVTSDPTSKLDKADISEPAEGNKNTEKGRGMSFKTIIFVILGVSLVVVTVGAAYFFYKRTKKTPEESVAASGVRHDSINSLYGVTSPPANAMGSRHVSENSLYGAHSPATGMGPRHVSENSLYGTHPQAGMTKHDSENSLYGYASGMPVA